MAAGGGPVRPAVAQRPPGGWILVRGVVAALGLIDPSRVAHGGAEGVNSAVNEPIDRAVELRDELRDPVGEGTERACLSDHPSVSFACEAHLFAAIGPPETGANRTR
ncbi:hypothetical protein GCM10008995_06560 [Halobellus salinus]|uniref:Uncharacterized protein n=1 Tax=Halobellus salinus TaxID=931585 RepID=A0A830E844_9EURY|nr:hypothetical protein GCM10008995_06560 [Halobellus salinus]